MARILRPQGACAARALVAGWLLLMSITGCAHLGQSPSQPSTRGPASGPPETGEPKSSAARADTASGAAPKSEDENSSAAAKARSGHGATPEAAKPPSAAKGTSTKANSATGNSATGKGQSRAAAPPTLALSEIEQRLRDTHAIGVFTKLSLKNQIDDLLGQLRAYHLKQTGASLPQLRRRYDVLLQRVIDSLQSGDASLASDISSSREAIWTMLTDPTTISKL
jgi:hypothetical protein